MTIENLENLMQELDYEALRKQHKCLDDLSLEELRAVLAYEMASDGMEWPDIEELWAGKNEEYQRREDILSALVNCFGY